MNRPMSLRGFCAALLLTLLPGTALAAPVPLDRIAVVVNDGVITSTELDARIGETRARLTARGTAAPPPQTLARQVLESMVIEAVQLQFAAQLGLRVGDVELNAALRDIARRNNLDLLQLREALVRDGIDFNRYREEVRKEMVISRLRERIIKSRITASEREIDSHLAREATLGNVDMAYHIAQILIAVPAGSTPDRLQAAKARIEQLREAILAGADFAETAVAESDGQQALAGGDLGWRQAAEVPTLFAPWLAAMEPGGVSEPVRSPSGYHLIKLIDRRSEALTVVPQTLLRQLLITPNAILSDAKARERIERLRVRIVGGESFAELARANSDDTRSTSEGGELGWLNLGTAPPPIEQAMAQLAINEVSAPIRTEFGWHLIEVLDRREQDLTELVQRNRARNAILKRKLEEETDRWLRQLRDEAFIEYHLDEE